MPKEPDTTPTTEDTETPTDDVNTQATDETDTTEPATGQKFTFLSRHISALRALRLSGILTILSATALFASLNGSNNIFGPPTGLFPGLSLAFLLALVVWFWSCLYNARRRLFALFVTLFSVTSTGFLAHWWWSFYDQTSFKSVFLLAPSLASLGVGLLIATDLLLRGVRNHAGITPGNTDDPARFAPYHPGTDSTTIGKRILRGILRFILIVVPAAMLTAGAVVAHMVVNPVTQTTAPLPEGPLPERSTGIGTTLAWAKEVPGLLGTASGAAGPVMLTAEGVIGLNPADGSTLWSYARKNTRFCVENCDAPPLHSQHLFTSPTGRYIAVQFDIPEAVTKGPELVHDAMTVVLDSLTGQVTGEHPSSKKNKLQLTDSALLDGDTAYNLNDGTIRWKLPRSGDTVVRESTYSGPAGHRSFIVTGRNHMISDTDPTSFTEVANLADDPLTDELVVVNGWAVQYTNPPISKAGRKVKISGVGKREPSHSTPSLAWTTAPRLSISAESLA